MCSQSTLLSFDSCPKTHCTNSIAGDVTGTAAGVVGFWRRAIAGQNIVSGREVNWLIDGLYGERLPANFAPV
jgi:hypothetical protein